MAEPVITTRESLVWAVAYSIAQAENKIYAGFINADRQYVLDLIKQVQEIVPTT